MSTTWLLGLDLGGGSARCALLDAATGRTVVASRPFAAEADPETPAGSRFDAAGLRGLVAGVVADALARGGVAGSAVRGIACASMRHGSVVVDAGGEVLLTSTNRDARGALAMLQLGVERGESFLARTGRWPHPVLPAGRLRWLATERPERFARAKSHLAVSDWVGLLWTGEHASDPTQAGESLCFDLATRAWADDLIAELKLPRHLFPPIREPGAQLGRLRADAARELGLEAGIPVAIAGADTQMGLLGCGALAPGATAVIGGTTAPVVRVQEKPIVDARLWASHAAEPGLFVLESNAGIAGLALEWLAAALYAGEAHPVLHLLDDAARAPAGAAGLLSTHGADLMDARQPVLPIGHLTLSTLLAPDAAGRRGLIARACVEGLACSLRANLEQLDAAGLAGVGPLHFAGGLARSNKFARIVSDVCDTEVSVPREPEATAMGAALCAGVAAGVFRDLAEAAAACVGEAARLTPDPAARDVYAAMYPVWRELYAAEATARRTATGHALRFAMAARASAEGAASAVRPRVLVASDMDATSLASLREIAEVEYASFREKSRLLTGDALVDAVAGFDVFVTEIDVAKADALVRCRDLRVIAVCRGDAVNVDVAACTALGIPVLHTPGRNADAVADLTIAFLLALARKLVPANAYLREEGKAGDLGRMGRAFVAFQGRELWRRTVGLVGLGAVGRKVLARLRPFGARCLVHDPYVAEDDIRLCGAEPASLDALLAASDFVSLHAAVTEASRGLIGASQLARMPKGSFLVNTARAALVDEAALAEALSSGHLAGAALDVFAVEPPASDHPLILMPNVIATPHVGGNALEVAAHQGQIVSEDLARLVRGERPRHVLNPETLAGFSWTAPRKEPPADLLARLGDRPGPAVSDLMRDTAKP